MPTATNFKVWKTEVRQAVIAQAQDSDEGFRWIGAVDKPGA